MRTTIYVIDPNPDGQAWIEATLASDAHDIVVLDGSAALFTRLPDPNAACLIAAAEPDARTALALVRELRRRPEPLPVIVLGPHSAFRTAVDIARLEATDFLERPVSARQLRAAVRRARCGSG